MIIHIDEIPEQGMSLEGEELAEILAMEPAADFQPVGPLSYKLYVQMVDEGLLVRGSLSARMEGRCARCTQIFSTMVTDSGFLRDYSELRGAEDVDITEDLREAILLNLPRFPLCGEECEGLCSQCGADLNEKGCDCSNGESGGAWNALNSLNL